MGEPAGGQSDLPASTQSVEVASEKGQDSSSRILVRIVW